MDVRAKLNENGVEANFKISASLFGRVKLFDCLPSWLNYKRLLRRFVGIVSVAKFHGSTIEKYLLNIGTETENKLRDVFVGNLSFRTSIEVSISTITVSN